MPDYASYSYEELEGVYRHVDREKYPERFKIVEELLNTRTKEIKPELVNSEEKKYIHAFFVCLLYTSPSPRDKRQSRMPSSA